MAFEYKNRAWLKSMPEHTAETIQAITSQFAKGGTDNLENPQILNTPEIEGAGGLSALRRSGNPAEAFTETKKRVFAA